MDLTGNYGDPIGAIRERRPTVENVQESEKEAVKQTTGEKGGIIERIDARLAGNLWETVEIPIDVSFLSKNERVEIEQKIDARIEYLAGIYAAPSDDTVIEKVEQRIWISGNEICPAGYGAIMLAPYRNVQGNERYKPQTVYFMGREIEIPLFIQGSQELRIEAIDKNPNFNAPHDIRYYFKFLRLRQKI